jgi:xylulose-5-phosphate/fructose-6-phosphate phosphoketolase
MVSAIRILVSLIGSPTRNHQSSLSISHRMPTRRWLLPITACVAATTSTSSLQVNSQPRCGLLMMPPLAHCVAGIGICPWVGNEEDYRPDVVMACCADVPRVETLAAVAILREQLPSLKIRVLNIVDLMRLQPDTEHPHGMSDEAFDALFTLHTPVIFAYHGYPPLIHRLTYRRRNHQNLHIRGIKEEGSATTAFDMSVRNDLDRFHLVVAVLDRQPLTGSDSATLTLKMPGKLIEHHRYITLHGEALPEVRDWRWPG